MENLGYKEGSAKPIPNINKRRMSRARGSVIENEALPLSISPRYCKEKKNIYSIEISSYKLYVH